MTLLVDRKTAMTMVASASMVAGAFGAVLVDNCRLRDDIRIESGARERAAVLRGELQAVQRRLIDTHARAEGMETQLERLQLDWIECQEARGL